MQLDRPAGSRLARPAAVRQGADAVYTGFRDEASARHFAGLNFTDKQLEAGLELIRQQWRKLFIAVNTYALPDFCARWLRAVHLAAVLCADALIAHDPGLRASASRTHLRSLPPPAG